MEVALLAETAEHAAGNGSVVPLPKLGGPLLLHLLLPPSLFSQREICSP
ncbi:hypothetical protein TIFTF001_016155 [Ficus carica]|uniref:Uncharacterized protein n=1 Tax=Ficus carica TaxID=3494 RepID=A0AA88AIZ7_FICCA|nr:hypothetical protein TIFTF001_016155 [Ficus carica]